MTDNARCECGCRIFFNKQTVITTASGTVRDIPASMVMECVRCLKVYIASMDFGKKTLTPFIYGETGERELFKAALESWKNSDRPETNESHIILDEADKVDFARLGIE